MSGRKGKVMGGKVEASAALDYLGLGLAELGAEVKRVLDQGVHGLCFSAYLDGQSPELQSQLSPEQVRERLSIVKPHARWVRTFSCTDGNEAAPRIAHQLGLKTLVGAWLGDDPEINERELARVIEMARAGDCDVVAVGNEVLYRGDLTEDELIAYLRRVKEALPGIPVGYVDSYYLFCDHPKLVEVCDVLLINCYPFWERCSLEGSLAYLQEMVARVQAVAGGKRVVISETGWPAGGEVLGDAVPSPENALVYALNTFKWTQAADVDLFYFAAFDEQWKSGPEGGAGPHWGFWDTKGKWKYGR
jgi:exo-beta-1,3-glucanase (GH17 family)